MKQKFLLFSKAGDISWLADYLQKVEGHEAVLYIHDSAHAKSSEGIVKVIDDWYNYLGRGYIWVFDSCGFGKLQDWLRSKGEVVFGSSEKADELENERQAAQKWFAEAGFDQVESKNFKDFGSAVDFVKENLSTRWILKQNGDAPKSLNHMGKFPNSQDMLFHLRELKKKWNEHSFGPVDFDLMKVVEGVEVAASAFWNGKDFMRNSEGHVVGFLNFEEKKEADGGLGETTGEAGTTFFGTTDQNELFREILLRPRIVERLKSVGYRGVFDINCIKTKDGLVALEPTCRPGFPATSYEFAEGLRTGTGEMLAAVAKGRSTPIEVHTGWGMVMCVIAKPFPNDHYEQLSDDSTSLGEKLWILDKGEPAEDLSADQRKHIQLTNFCKTKDGAYKVATKCGYLLDVTARGESIKGLRERLIEYIRANVYISGMKFRQDIGKRVEPYEKEIESA